MPDAGRTPLPSLPADDLVLPFRTVKSDVIGRVVRLGTAIDTVLSGHSYPEPVSYALGRSAGAHRHARQRAEDPGQVYSADQDRRGPRLSGRRLRFAG